MPLSLLNLRVPAACIVWNLLSAIGGLCSRRWCCQRAAGVDSHPGAEDISAAKASEEGCRAALALTVVLTVRMASTPAAQLSLWRQARAPQGQSERWLCASDVAEKPVCSIEARIEA